MKTGQATTTESLLREAARLLDSSAWQLLGEMGRHQLVENLLPAAADQNRYPQVLAIDLHSTHTRHVEIVSTAAETPFDTLAATRCLIQRQGTDGVTYVFDPHVPHRYPKAGDTVKIEGRVGSSGSMEGKFLTMEWEIIEQANDEKSNGPG